MLKLSLIFVGIHLPVCLLITTPLDGLLIPFLKYMLF
jgi:hypothetical protein